MRRKIAIDLGTDNTVISSNGSIVLNEPTIVALSNDNNKIIAVGKEAQDMLGKTPETITPMAPVVGGTIADLSIVKAFLKIVLSKLYKSFELFGPDIMMAVPAGSTSVERRAALEAALEAGAAHAYVVDATLAAAIGAGVAVSSPTGSVILHMGADVTEAAVISLGGIVTSESNRIGGNTIDEAIRQEIKDKHGLTVGKKTSEEIKIKMLNTTPNQETVKLTFSGRDLVFGMPRSVNINSKEIYTATLPTLNAFSRVLESALEKTPPELSSDVIDKGVVLTGGGARLKNFDKFITENTDIPTLVAEDPELCVARGAAVVLENLELWKRSILTKS